MSQFSILTNIPALRAARVLSQVQSAAGGPVAALSSGDRLASDAQPVAPVGGSTQLAQGDSVLPGSHVDYLA